MFVTTHYMEEAEYCNRLALMNRGRLIALGRPAKLREELHQPLLELQTDDPARAVEALTGSPGVLTAAMFGRSVHVMAEDAAAALNELPPLLEGAGRTCESLAVVEPSLEDVFVALVLREGGAVEG